MAVAGLPAIAGHSGLLRTAHRAARNHLRRSRARPGRRPRDLPGTAAQARSDDWQTYAYSLGFTFAGAVIFTLTRTRDHRVPQEALIGIVYVVAAAASILLLSRGSAEANEEIKRTLIGDVLTVSPRQ